MKKLKDLKVGDNISVSEPYNQRDHHQFSGTVTKIINDESGIYLKIDIYRFEESDSFFDDDEECGYKFYETIVMNIPLEYGNRTEYYDNESWYKIRVIEW